MKKVLYIVEAAEGAQFRYRVENVCEALSGGDKWRGEWVEREKLFSERDFAKGVDLVVFGRQTAKNGAVMELVRWAKEAGVKVMMDLDDLIFDLRDLPVIMRGTGSLNVSYWVGYVMGVRRIARKMDGFIATNEFLAGKLERSFGRRAVVIPNSLNAAQIKEAEKWGGKKDREFLVGYFSGSPTHKKDFRVAEEGLVRFLEEFSEAKLLVVGYMEFSGRMNELEAAGRVRREGVVDYLRLMKLMAEVEVNIAPLALNDFTNCKSELKFFEAGVAGTVTVASPRFTFSRAIVDGENGLLAEEGEWFEKLKFLHENPKERKRMAERAKKYAMENYYGKKFLEMAERALGELMEEGR